MDDAEDPTLSYSKWAAIRDREGKGGAFVYESEAGWETTSECLRPLLAQSLTRPNGTEDGPVGRMSLIIGGRDTIKRWSKLLETEMPTKFSVFQWGTRRLQPRLQDVKEHHVVLCHLESLNRGRSEAPRAVSSAAL